ncbi:MAG: GxxExxY protein [Verrucomicrobia bacterium]|nr:GxxExxY protein [Verrucomicrobiota bacterium]
MENKLTSLIIKAAYDVHNELGFGFLEKIYQRALKLVLDEIGLESNLEQKVEVLFRNQYIGEYFADVIVSDEVVLELKAVKELCPEHSAQLINYLKAGNYKTGLLINFGAPKLEFKRLYS